MHVRCWLPRSAVTPVGCGHERCRFLLDEAASGLSTLTVCFRHFDKRLLHGQKRKGSNVAIRPTCANSGSLLGNIYFKSDKIISLFEAKINFMATVGGTQFPSKNKTYNQVR